jgi:hypothetical protein
MGWMLRHPHGPSRSSVSSGVVDFRSTVVSRGFSALAVVRWTCCPVLRGRAEARSFPFLVGTWSARARESRAYSSAG